MNKYEQAEFFGLTNRLVKLSEECGELIQALTKYLEVLYFNNRDTQSYKDNIEEELADVYLVSSEVRYLLNIHGHDIDERIKKKVARTNEVIKQKKIDDSIEYYINESQIVDTVNKLKKGMVNEGKCALDLLLKELNVSRDLT